MMLHAVPRVLQMLKRHSDWLSSRNRYRHIRNRSLTAHVHSVIKQLAPVTGDADGNHVLEKPPGYQWYDPTVIRCLNQRTQTTDTPLAGNLVFVLPLEILYLYNYQSREQISFSGIVDPRDPSWTPNNVPNTNLVVPNFPYFLLVEALATHVLASEIRVGSRFILLESGQNFKYIVPPRVRLQPDGAQKYQCRLRSDIIYGGRFGVAKKLMSGYGNRM